VFGHDKGDILLKDTGVDVTDNIQEAGFILIAGADRQAFDFEAITPVLKEGVRRGLKAICLNPDSHALLGANYLMGPGLIARRYQDYGGIVHYIGKPHGPIFQHCTNLFKEHDVYPAQTVMIGDTSFDMDMAKAAGVGAIGVSWGYHDISRLHAADRIVDSFPALDEALHDILGARV
jgi:ribonucleotide monophosphatase NagD (HAD superfamily)